MITSRRTGLKYRKRRRTFPAVVCILNYSDNGDKLINLKSMNVSFYMIQLLNQRYMGMLMLSGFVISVNLDKNL